MRAKLGLLALLVEVAIMTRTGARAKEFVDYINPMIGASTSRRYGEGKTFPGAATPFGLVQLSPDTITGGDNGPGYSYHHRTIEGFSFTHMSGIGWYGDLGNFQVMPTTGPLQADRERAKSPFSHDDETASAGYYSVALERYGVRAELTAAPRAGIIRFTYPESATSRIQIDLARRVGQNGRWLKHGKQRVEVVDDHTIRGWMYCPNSDGGWGHGRGRVSFTQHFLARFSKPIRTFGVWDKDAVMPGRRFDEGKNTGFYTEFATKKGEQVLVKAGISYVRAEGARANLEHDIPGWDFDGVRAKARALWADALEGVDVEGGTDAQREVFATALYHCFIDPRSVSDVDGRYIGADSKPHRAEGFVYRSIFSGWDVFRSQFPLLTIIRPDIVNDEVNSLIQMAELSGRGYLPRWEILNAYSGCMVGDPGVSVIAEAYLKGIRGYDAEKAYAACRQTVLGPKTNRNGFGDYMRLGYVPGSVSCTLENAYFDYCAARFAEALGKKEDAAKLYKMSMNYRNIYDPSVGNMRAKQGNGSWAGWRGLTRHGQGCVESNPYQQGWFVPHDVRGLVNLMGGDAKFLAHLVPFFEKTPRHFRWNEYYNHANEPVHHVVYMFPYAGAPWLSQKWARIVMAGAYGPGVKGLCGNEDVGQMSAWVLLSTMGFHPVAPCSGVYVIGSPMFNKVSVRLDPKYYKGRSFTIVARGNSPENIYIRSAKLNGRPLERAWITHDEIVSGGTLEFVMGPEPNRKWASAPEHAPPSLTPVLACTELRVEKGPGGGYVARATLRDLGGGSAAGAAGALRAIPRGAVEFPVSVLSGGKALASATVKLAPGEEKALAIPFTMRGRPEGEYTLSVLGREATLRHKDTAPPTVVSVRAGPRRIAVTFSEPVDPRTATRREHY
ncbi:MAG: GH92 family glycosyl hydrolase, partial [Planctomycetota bacterium]